MFPYWDLAIAPLLRAADVKRLVEIGALRGDNTRRIIDHLGPAGELHVIDPAPGFDPSEQERAFGGRYVFHPRLSLDVLGDLPPMDAALIDGDHNWYTVFHELTLLRESSRRAGAGLPLLVLHDVGWPYGRRDLYYDPDTIPAEHRHPHRRAGMRVGRSELVDRGGMSAGLRNAEREGGPRNGVMTALEDFLAEHDRPTRTVVLPAYFGLAIVAEEAMMERHPRVAEELDRLEGAEGRLAQVELGEELRVRSIAHNHTLIGERDARIERLVRRHLDGVRRALTKELNPEDTVRIRHLLDVVEEGAPLNRALLRDPVRNATAGFESVTAARRVGALTEADQLLGDRAPIAGGSVLLLDLERTLDDLLDRRVDGDVAVVGVGSGSSALFARAHQVVHDRADRHLWMVDRFRADRGDDLNIIRDRFHRFDLLDEGVHLLQGDPEATLPTLPAAELAAVLIGSIAPDEIDLALDHLHRRLAVGGVVVVEDASDESVRHALDRFRARHDIESPMTRIGSSGTTWQKQQPDRSTEPPSHSVDSSTVAPLARPASDPVDLSVVVVFHNMEREAPRTLHALSRAYQLDLEGITYEVIAVENGSHPDRRLGADLVRSFGPELRYLDMAEEATPSPAAALNAGIAASRGDAIALMVDGAHIVTPRVLHHGLAGLRTYAPAIVATQQWYLGPGQQGDVMRSGYDQAYEDQLLAKIDWPIDGYRLFEVGHFVGDRDWLDGMWESNCLFATRAQLAQVGGFDEGFSMPGGGYTNLDLYERLGSSPDVTIVTILGEGSFHQVHGGTTTNLTDSEERRSRVHGYAQHHAELRGRPFIGPEKPIRYVGALTSPASKRSRGRRLTAPNFDVDPAIEGDDGPLGRPVPIPDDQRDAFIAAYWRSRAWQQVTWLGRKVPNAPADLMTYQELVSEIRPDWIIETGTRGGGRARFLASVCDLLDHGRIISIDMKQSDRLPGHPRVTHLTGSPLRDDTMEAVLQMTGEAPRGLVILGTRGRRNRMVDEFEALAPLVSVGSYAVIEHTVLNGRPIDASHGPGPFEAMRIVRERHGNFIVDHEREGQALTFNLNGYLKRIR